MSEPAKVNPILPEVMLNGILKTGLVVVGGKNTGKSNAGKVISSEIIRNQPLPIQLKIFDTASNLRWDFEPILFQSIDERTRYFYDGDEHILFDIALVDEIDILSFVERVILTDYYRMRARKELLGGHINKWILYLIEEAQNEIGSYSLMRREGMRLLKFFSEGRNFNQSYILIGQRLADVSTRAIERCSGYLFGKMTGDNDIAKLKRIVGRDSVIVNDVKKLEVEKGQFLYYNGASTYDFNCPKYDSKGQKPKPYILDLKNIPTWRYREGVRII